MMIINRQWLESADAVLQECKIVIENRYLSCYRTYLDNFSTSIVQSGIVAAAVFYEKRESESVGNRYVIIRCIFKLLKKQGDWNNIKPDRNYRLSKYAIDTVNENRHDLVQSVLKAVTYLKLALRQYTEVITKDQEIIEAFKIEDVAPGVKSTNTESILTQNEFRETFQEVSDNTKSNIGWCFYRDFYQDFTYDKEIIKTQRNNGRTQEQGTKLQLNYAKRTKYICQSVLTDVHIKRNLCILENLPGETFELQTVYPGLLIGTGLNHESGEKNDVKIGFMFDYTTGLPYIPGSSIKGVLRSMFPFEENKSKQRNSNEYIQNRVNYINSKLGTNYEDKLLLNLAWDVFEQKLEISSDENNDNCRKDIFFDALITDTGNDSRYIIGDDFITPHKYPLSSPKPLQFIKVLPNVKFTFKFKLYDSKISDDVIITANQKYDLFKSILLDVGLGAKTNVGYGRFVLPND